MVPFHFNFLSFVFLKLTRLAGPSTLFTVENLNLLFFLIVLFLRHDYYLVEVKLDLVSVKLNFNFALILLLAVIIILNLYPVSIPAIPRQ